jgi:hypothetical protein
MPGRADARYLKTPSDRLLRQPAPEKYFLTSLAQVAQSASFGVNVKCVSTTVLTPASIDGAPNANVPVLV